MELTADLVVLAEIENVTMQEGSGVHLDPGNIGSGAEVGLEVGKVVTVPGVDQLQRAHHHHQQESQ